MILFPTAKINLGLNVTERRADGYHNLETVFYPVMLEDILEVVCAPEKEKTTTFALTGNAIECSPDQNIVLKAYHLLEKAYNLPPVQIHLHKHIPSGAGLGGGSADGAYMIRLLNELFNLNITNQKCLDYAVKLGADCPFFIRNEPSYATGIGEKLEPLELDLSTYYILIVKPPVFVSTAAAFQRIQPATPALNVRDIVTRYPLAEWRNLLRNDFESSVFPQYPELAEIKEKLYSHGALYASMSGSGSSLYGIFKENPADISPVFSSFFTWWSRLVRK